MTTMNVVARPTTSARGKYDTATIVDALIALGESEALSVDVTGLKFVNFHSVVYKKAKSLGYKLHYSLSGVTCRMWVSAE